MCINVGHKQTHRNRNNIRSWNRTPMLAGHWPGCQAIEPSVDLQVFCMCYHKLFIRACFLLRSNFLFCICTIFVHIIFYSFFIFFLFFAFRFSLDICFIILYFILQQYIYLFNGLCLTAQARCNKMLCKI